MLGAGQPTDHWLDSWRTCGLIVLIHWDRVTHICVGKLIIICSDNGSSPGRHQAIIWTNAGILLIWTLGTNFSEILSEIHIFSFKKIYLKMPSAKMAAILSRPQCVNEMRQGSIFACAVANHCLSKSNFKFKKNQRDIFGTQLCLFGFDSVKTFLTNYRSSHGGLSRTLINLRLLEVNKPRLFTGKMCTYLTDIQYI